MSGRTEVPQLKISVCSLSKICSFSSVLLYLSCVYFLYLNQYICFFVSLLYFLSFKTLHVKPYSSLPVTFALCLFVPHCLSVSPSLPLCSFLSLSLALCLFVPPYLSHVLYLTDKYVNFHSPHPHTQDLCLSRSLSLCYFLSLSY